MLSASHDSHFYSCDIVTVTSLSCLLQKVLFGLWAVGSDTVRGWTFQTEISMENFQMRGAGWGDPPHGLLLVPSQTSLGCSNEWK